MRYPPEVTLNSSWKSPRYDLTLSMFYKFTGKSPGFLLDENDKIENYTIDSYHNMDLTILKKFDDWNTTLSFGVINLFDVTTISSSQVGQGIAHTGANTALPVGYGRTVFAKVEFNIK